jgi:hypothetical protein
VEVDAEGQEEAHGERDPEYVSRSERMSTTSAASTATDVPEETAMSTGGCSKRRRVVDAVADLNPYYSG